MLVTLCSGASYFQTAPSTPSPGLNEAQRIVEEMRGMSMSAEAIGKPTSREEQRRQIIKRLHGLGASQTVIALSAALRDPDIQMRQNAALALIELGGGYSRDVTPPLDIRAALTALMDATADEDSGVRAWSAHAIAEMGPAATPAIPALVRLLRDSEEGPRNTACIALGRIGPAAAEALPALRHALNDPSSDVRGFARRAIDRIEGKSTPWIRTHARVAQ